MRRFSYFLLAVTVLLYSCETGNSNDSEASSSDSSATEQAAAVDGHDSQNSLDWTGKYTGTLPCDDCDELQAEVTLEENGRYSRKLIYKGKSNTPLLSAGMFEWNEAGSAITLKSFKGNVQVFKVGENKLIYQMPEGSSGEYILSKVQEKPEEAV